MVTDVKLSGNNDNWLRSRQEGIRLGHGKLIDGKAIAAKVRSELAAKTKQLMDTGLQPGLAVILVGDDPASKTYVRAKVRACKEVKIHSELIQLSVSVKETELLNHIYRLNEDPAIHGVLVQLPLPPHISTERVIAAIAPEKDVDGFHPTNVGRMVVGLETLLPCTPRGIMELLRRMDIAVAGKHAVVVGRSNIVGKPVALLLQQADATVTMCHSKTRDLASLTRQGEILIVAAGRPGLITREHVREGAVVIDVGIHRTKEGRLTGDVRFDEVLPQVSHITPVPGGVGPMTIAMLLHNTVQAAEQAE